MSNSKKRIRDYDSYGDTDSGDLLRGRGDTTDSLRRSEYSRGLETTDTSVELDSLPPSDDPVRMYLKEIGQVPLLNNNREMWLSMQIAAERHLETLRDELMSLDHATKDRREPDYLDVERYAYRKMAENWHSLQDRIQQFNEEMPDFLKVLNEVQSVIGDWDSDADSYIRSYLNRGKWGKDDEWTRRCAAILRGRACPFPVSGGASIAYAISLLSGQRTAVVRPIRYLD